MLQRSMLHVISRRFLRVVHPDHLTRAQRHLLISRHRSTSDRPESSASEDFYSLLLASPLEHSTSARRATKAAVRVEDHRSDVVVTSPSYGKTALPITFSTPLQGPSARMRGLSRGEQGLERPPEPDNCCMSGCVNCVWDAYREEVEQWAAARQRRKLMQSHADVEYIGSEARGEEAKRRIGSNAAQAQRSIEGMDEGVGDSDEVGGLREYDGYDLGSDGENGLFEGVPIGIREFMNTEKRLRERKEAIKSKEPST